MARGILYSVGIVTMLLLGFLSVLENHAQIKNQEELERTQKIMDTLARQCSAKYPLGGERLDECIECAMARNDL